MPLGRHGRAETRGCAPTADLAFSPLTGERGLCSPDTRWKAAHLLTAFLSKVTCVCRPKWYGGEMQKKLTCCFAGTRQGMTEKQLAEVERLFKDLGITTIYHGAAVGADEQASLIAQRMELNVRAFPGNVAAD